MDGGESSHKTALEKDTSDALQESSSLPYALQEWNCGDKVSMNISKHKHCGARIVRHHKTGTFRKGEGDEFYYVELNKNRTRKWVSAQQLTPYLPIEVRSLRALKIREEKEEIPNDDNRDNMEIDAAEKAQRCAKATGAVKKVKNKPKEHIIPLTVSQRLSTAKADKNTLYDQKNVPLTDSESSIFKDFLRRGHNFICDEFATAEPDFMSSKSMPVEIEHHLCMIWKYMSEHRTELTRTSADSENSGDEKDYDSKKNIVTKHINWCIVCNGRSTKENLEKCTKCPVAFHQDCRKNFPVAIDHRKNVAKAMPEINEMLEKASASVLRGESAAANTLLLCPPCTVGIRIRYGDIVWFKLSTYPWWPARVLLPGELPACLLASKTKRGQDEWPVQFYGEARQYAWAHETRMCMLMPNHAVAENSNKDLSTAFESACNDYIRTYLK